MAVALPSTERPDVGWARTARSGLHPRAGAVRCQAGAWRLAVSLLKLLPARIHGLGDYGSAFALILVGLLVDGSGEARGTGVVLGLVLLVVSLLTDYPLGVRRIIPFKLHSAGDYLGAGALITAPFLLGFSDTDEGLTAFYVAVGAVLVAVSLLTDYDHPDRGAELGVHRT